MSAVEIHYLNCFTCNTRVPAGWRTGTLCLLIETGQGLVLVDTGPGREDTPAGRASYARFRWSTTRRWTDLAYVRRHIAHQPEFAL